MMLTQLRRLFTKSSLTTKTGRLFPCSEPMIGSRLALYMCHLRIAIFVGIFEIIQDFCNVGQEQWVVGSLSHEL